MIAASRGGVRYDTGLVEAAVLAAVEHVGPDERAEFRARRDGLYEAADGDDRDAAFEALHGEWFVRLRLDRPLHAALAERPTVAALGECRVLPARSRRDEMADLAAAPHRSSSPLLVVRLRPQSFLDLDALTSFLRRELLHVADMLDPSFGYERELPAAEEGPSYDNVLRDRYRVVWTTSVAGRLAGARRVETGELEQVRRDFDRAFCALGDGVSAAFERWLREPRPSHAAIVDFILAPGRGERAGGRCSLCRFPSALVESRWRPDADLLRTIRDDQPGWRAEAGICPQCRDLYSARARQGALA